MARNDISTNDVALAPDRQELCTHCAAYLKVLGIACRGCNVNPKGPTPGVTKQPTIDGVHRAGSDTSSSSSNHRE